jgi:hypothetical protein
MTKERHKTVNKRTEKDKGTAQNRNKRTDNDKGTAQNRKQKNRQ